jgi:hypothetical protein
VTKNHPDRVGEFPQSGLAWAVGLEGAVLLLRDRCEHPELGVFGPIDGGRDNASVLRKVRLLRLAQAVPTVAHGVTDYRPCSVVTPRLTRRAVARGEHA